MRPARPLGMPLSSRERDIAILVAQGLTNKQIAARLGLAEMSVKNTLTTLFEKLGVENRVYVAIYAVKAGLISLDDIALPCERCLSKADIERVIVAQGYTPRIEECARYAESGVLQGYVSLRMRGVRRAVYLGVFYKIAQMSEADLVLLIASKIAQKTAQKGKE